MESSYLVSRLEDTNFLYTAMRHIINKFKLNPPEHLLIYRSIPLSYYFVKRNTNRYFRKHLGFTYTYVKDGTMVTITDHKKHMLFKLQYGV